MGFNAGILEILKVVMQALDWEVNSLKFSLESDAIVRQIMDTQSVEDGVVNI